MFTGIIRCMGRIIGRREGYPSRGRGIDVECAELQEAPGESIAVNGCCLTVAASRGATFSFDLSEETVSRTTLAGLPAGTAVNLEPALRAGDAIGGHFVTGHVDGIGKLASRSEAQVLRFEAPEELIQGMVLKGSVALDGVSLTVSALGRNWCEVAIIPVTRARTNLGSLHVGEEVNIETDLLGKHVLAALGKGGAGKLTMEFLKEHGFA
ncbi:MAG: riboflavin synthase [Planctomycetota bacterium]